MACGSGEVKMKTKEEIIEVIKELTSECAELIHIMSKVEKFGPKLYHPDDLLTNNTQLLEKELGHCMQMQEILIMAMALNRQNIRQHALNKGMNVLKFKRVDW